MSTTIDQRVVEMRFDNKNFENNARESMSTLERLKQKLNFSGASKGFNDINSAANKVNMSGLSGAVDTVQAKFSAMQVVGVTALANITNSAVNAGKRMLSALTIDPVKTGFSEYETQINSTQTILANTASKGSDINDVNKALEELNLYADKTIYNFTEMTRNIGTFTAAGIDLDTSVNAIQGIANLAAVSGSTSQQASTAMYQLSQALAAGTVKLMDWNSVVNAGMGGEMFQNALKKTSEELGTGAEAAIKASGSFRESLRDGWLTSEVLTETLKKFTTTGANEYISEYTGLTKEAVEAETKRIASAKDTGKAIDEAAESLAKMSGKSKEEIKSVLEFAQNAEDAATKVKTFSQLWDVMKESAQSGWSQTWKLLIGDFAEAKSLLTPLADFMTGFINKMSEARNAVLESALGKSFTGFADKIKTVVDPIKKTADGVKEVVKSVEQYTKVVDEIMGGKWGNGQERWDKLTEAGYDWAHAQNLVNEQLGSSVRHTTKYTEAQKSAADAQEKTSEASGKLTEADKKRLTVLASLTEEELKAKGYSDEQIASIKELCKMADKLGMSVEDFLNNLDNLDGRWLLINSFKNAGQGLVTVFKSIGQAWREAFHGDASDEEILEKRSQKLFDLIAAFHKFTTKLKVSDETAEKLTRTFKGVFAALDLITTVVGGGFKIAFKLLSSILGYFNLDILDVTASIGDAIVKFRDWFDSIFDVSGILDVIVPALKNAAKAVKGWVKAFKELPVVQKIVNKVKSTIEKLKEIDLKEVGKNIIDGLVNGLGDGAKKVIQSIIDLGTKLIEGICNLLGIHSPSTVFIAIGGFIIAGLIAGIKEGLISVPESMQGIVDKCIAIFQNIDWGTILALGLSIGSIMFIKKIGDALEAFAAPFEGIGDILSNTADLIESFTKVTKSLSMEIKTKALKNLAVSLLILVGAVAAIMYIADGDYKTMMKAVGVIGALAIILGVLAVATSLMSSTSIDLKEGTVDGLKQNLLTIGLAILVLAATVKIIGKMNPEEAKQGFLGLAGVMVAMLAFLAISRKIVSNKALKNIGQIGSLMIKMAFALGLMVGVAKLAGMLSIDEMKNAAMFAGGFVVFIAALNLVTQKTSKNIGKLGGMMLKLSIAMALMVGVCKLISTLNTEDMLKGVIFAAAFVLFVKALVKSTTIGNDKQIAKLGGLLLSISLSMMMMVGVCKLVNLLSVEDMLKGAIFAAAFVLFVKRIVAVTSVGSETQLAKVAGTILMLSISVGILAGISVMLSLVSLAGLAKGVLAVAALGSIMALMIWATRGANDVKGNLIAMTVAIAIMAAAVAGLSFIDPKKLAGATLAISIVMGMFALMIKATSTVQKAMGNLIVMTVAIGVMAGALWLLSKLEVKSTIENAIALSVLMVAVSGSMLLLSKMGTTFTGALKGVIALTAMVIPMLAFVGVLALMNKIQNASANAMLLTGLMTAMTLLLIPLTVIGYLWVGAAIGLVALTAMVIPMLAFIGILALMNKVENATSNAKLLIGLITVMTGVLTQLAIIGPLALIGVGAMAGLTGLMGAIGLMATAVGALMEKFPSLQSFLDKGLPVLEQLAGSIGRMVGKFVGGIGEGLGDSLVKIGEDITAFMDALQEASKHAEGIKGESFDGVKQLIESLVGVGIASVGVSFADMFTKKFGNKTAMKKFEDDGKAFFTAIQGISTVMKDTTMPENFSTEGLLTLVKAIAEVGIATIGMTFADMFTGDKTAMEKFEADGKAFFTAIQGISGVMKNTTMPEDFSTDGLMTLIDSIKSVGKAVIGVSFADFFATGENTSTAMTKFEADGKAFFTAIDSIAGVMKDTTIPEDFSTKSIITILDCIKSVGAATVGVSFADIFTLGGTSMDKFKTDGVALFSAIKDISSEASNINTGSFSTAETAIADIKRIIASTKGIDYSGVEKFTGIGTGGIGADGPMHDIAVAIKDFGDTVAGINTAAVSTSVTAASKIRSLIAGLVNLDTSGIEKFKIKDIGSAMKSYAKQVDGIDAGLVSSSISSAKNLASLIRSLVGLDNSGVALFNVKSIGDKMKAYSGAVSDIDAGAISSSISAANKLKNLINSLAGLDTSGVGSFKSAIESLGKIQVGNIEQVFKNAASTMTVLGTNLIDGIANGMRSRQASLVAITSAIVNQLVNHVRRSVTVFRTTGITLMTSFASGMNSQRGRIISAVISSITSAVARMRAYYGSFYSAGSYLVSGFADGISANTFRAEAKAAAMASAAYEAAKEALDINSPSKVFRKLGYSVPEGFAMGIDKFSRVVTASSTMMAEGAIDNVRDSINRLGDIVNSDIDSYPTIRPVLDLSDVKTGVSAISGLFNEGASVGVRANVSAINSAMNRRNQNGANDDVVSAIDKLRKDIGNISSTTYNVNGITYDDGSAVADAVNVLTRAAIRERRV